MRYYIHEMVENEKQKNEWEEKHFRFPCRQVHCHYWPHYSLRPSVIRTEVYEKVGRFNEEGGHFEMEYAYEYFKKYGFISAFFEGIYCKHIGRLTSQRFDKKEQNAYELNDEAQFIKKDKQKNAETDEEIEEIQKFDMTTFNTNPFNVVSMNDYSQSIQRQKPPLSVRIMVINLSHRQDRWQKFCENASELEFLNYERFEAVNGETLQPSLWLQRLFDGNDYNMRAGIVGCAMSHIKLYIDLINSDYAMYLILEDDLTFTPNFEEKFRHLLRQTEIFDWDMVYLGHHLRNDASDEEKNEAYNSVIFPRIEKWNSSISFMRSMGGTGGYLIHRCGAERLLNYIERNGMTNGIDTVQQKAANELNVFYATPHLYYTDCWRGTKQIDTDIQHNFNSLTMPIQQRFDAEVEYYGDNLMTIKEMDILALTKSRPVLYTGEQTERLKEQLNSMNDSYRFFCLDDQKMFILPLKIAPSRLKNKNGKWNVQFL